jgi:DnaJ homolog subfamily C member 25
MIVRLVLQRAMIRLLMILLATSWFVAASEESASPPSSMDDVDSSFDVTNEDWGSYYDPQNVFCGKYDCYKILGFDYESYFGKNLPDTRIITKRYRKLSREWHPDKSTHRHAKEKFVKIARAYEVLTDVKVRAEYDALRYDQEAYFQKYGASVLWTYAPQTDVTVVALLLLVLANVVSWFTQQHRWNMVANRLTKAAAENWTTAQGGTPESKLLREQALQIWQEQQAAASTAPAENGTTTTAGSKKPAKKQKEKKSKKQPESQDALRAIITELVNEMHDFGGGFHKPTWRDLFVVQMAQLPITMAQSIVWQLRYSYRRYQNIELNDEEKQVLTARAVGPVLWDTTAEAREALIQRELWIKENLIQWQEEQEIKNLSSAEQKAYYKSLRKQKAGSKAD